MIYLFVLNPSRIKNSGEKQVEITKQSNSK